MITSRKKQINWTGIVTESDKDYICAHVFTVKTRTGKLVSGCFVTGRLEDKPSLCVRTKDFGILRFQFSWQNLRNAIQNETAVLI